jgi:glycosyltransferase involved in cell wall biosynthesis
MAEIQILQLIKGLDIGGVNGGAERFCMDLSRQLSQLGYKVTICAFFRMHTPAEAQALQALRVDSLEVIQLAEWRGNGELSSYRQALQRLEEFVQTHPVQIVHSHFQLGTLAALRLKLKQPNLIALRTVHNVQEWEQTLAGRLKAHIFTERVFPARLDAEVGVSQAIVEQLQAHPAVKRHSEKIHLIHNAIALPEALPEIKPSKAKEQGFIIGSAGRLAEQKGYRFLLAAMTEVLKAIPGCELHLAGEGKQKADLIAFAEELGIASKVKFRGYLGNIPDFLSGLDLFVSSSLWEGLPTAILEVIMAGVPVLATDIAGNRELIHDGKTGWLVQPANAHALARGMIQAYSQPELRQRFAQEARATLPQFSIHTVAEQYDQLYQQLLAGEA